MTISNYKLKPEGQYCRCPTCHEVFTGEAGFEEHRFGDYDKGRSCLPLEAPVTTFTSKEGKSRKFVLESSKRGSFWRLR